MSPEHRNTRLAGHGLQAEGKAFIRGDPDEEQRPWVRVRGHIGRGVCSCGEGSNVEWSDAARKRWHREHKEQQREASRA